MNTPLLERPASERVLAEPDLALPSLARNLTRDQIRAYGAIGNLNDGVEFTTHSIRTRAIAWPGNGTQTQSVHVLTHAPGDESEFRQYAVSEEAMLCLKGKGEVYLRDRWVTVEAGDIAYFPEGTVHATRSARENSADFVLVTQITPPPLDLYEAEGLYVRRACSFNFTAIDKARRNARLGSISPESELHLNESHPEVRSWNLERDDIRRNGALFNMFKGASFPGLDVPMVLMIWPGFGTRTAKYHSGFIPPGRLSLIHTHPVSDECLIQWAGGPGRFYVGDAWVDVGPLDCVIAPSGVYHGAGGGRHAADEPTLVGGFASPPQLDLYLLASYYRDGEFARLPHSVLSNGR